MRLKYSRQVPAEELLPQGHVCHTLINTLKRAVCTCTAHMLISCQHRVHLLHAVEPLMQQKQQAYAIERFCLSVSRSRRVVGKLQLAACEGPARGCYVAC